MPFRGWPAEALEFFEGLAADNSKAYWQAHRTTYDRVVKGPMDLLLAELAPEFGEPKLFRPYRDVRFSPDKTPYKTHIGATLTGLRGPNAAPGLRGPNAAAGLRGPNAAPVLRGPNAAAGLRGPNAAPGLRGPNAAPGLRGPNAAAVGYVQLSADGLGVGSGMYHLAPDQLDRFRRAVADDRTGEEIAGIVAGLRAAKLDVAAHETLKRAPRGCPKDHPRVDLLRHKGLIVWKSWEPAAWLGTAKAKDRVVDVLRAARPLQDWLETNVGPSRTAS